MLYTINELRHTIFQKVYDTYEIFQNFFGQEYTDLQLLPTDSYLLSLMMSNDIQESKYEDNYEVTEEQLQVLINYFSNLYPRILVWWPQVTVSNENDRSIVIYDLYAKIDVTPNGCIPYENQGFQLTRSTYTDVQFANKYCHSHVPSIGIGDLGFHSPCLGKGPIKRTILDLKSSNEEALWMLFCQELSMYVTVESLSGGPYKKLEDVSWKGASKNFHHFPEKRYIDSIDIHDFQLACSDFSIEDLITEFTEFYLSKCSLKFSFHNGSYDCGISCYDFMMDISNAFISWVNQKNSADLVEILMAKNIIRKLVVADREFYSCKQLTSEEENCIDETILYFKNNPVGLNIIPDLNAVNYAHILDYDIAMYILVCILSIINYHYNGNNTDNTGGEEASSSNHQTVLYL